MNHSKGFNGIAHVYEKHLVWGGTMVTKWLLTYLHRPCCWEAHRFCGGKDALEAANPSVYDGDFMKHQSQT